MPMSATLAGEAIELFESRWRDQLSHTRVRIGDIDCPLHWLMPELLQLMREFDDDAPLRAMRPLVRRLVQEMDTVNLTAFHEEHDQVLESYVDTLIHVLEQVRDQARQRGQWVASCDTAPPPMCG